MNFVNEWVELASNEWNARTLDARESWLKVSELDREEAHFAFAELSPKIREAYIEDLTEAHQDQVSEIILDNMEAESDRENRTDY